MTIQTLENISIGAVAETFTEAFSDYIVPLRMSETQLAGKIKSDSLRLDLSVGAFDKGRLTGFILHGFDEIDGKKVVYNGGTGVIPACRGKQLTRQLYEYALPLLKEQAAEKLLLEVITTNTPAIKTYTSTGFHICRTLNCYKGTIRSATADNDFTIKPFETYDWQLMQSWWDSKPSWQNAITALNQLKAGNIAIGAYNYNTLVGYLIFNPAANRVQQFAVDARCRNQGIARQLFAHLAANYSTEISIINVDSKAAAVDSFLKSMGLNQHIPQYEMEMNVKD